MQLVLPADGLWLFFSLSLSPSSCKLDFLAKAILREGWCVPCWKNLPHPSSLSPLFLLSPPITPCIFFPFPMLIPQKTKKDAIHVHLSHIPVYVRPACPHCHKSDRSVKAPRSSFPPSLQSQSPRYTPRAFLFSLPFEPTGKSR